MPASQPKHEHAQWSISLDTTCPKCDECFNLLDDPDFWDGGRVEPIEHGTPNTTGVEVICPKCEHKFLVNYGY